LDVQIAFKDHSKWPRQNSADEKFWRGRKKTKNGDPTSAQNRSELSSCKANTFLITNAL